MSPEISIAIETSCRAGGVALGRGGDLLESAALGPSARHAADLLPTLDALLRRHGLGPAQIDWLFVSVGPGSFTGLRVGVTLARTFAQAMGVKLLAVPTPRAVAWRVREELWRNLGVMLAAKDRTVHATLFQRDEADQPQAVGPYRLATPEEFLDDGPRPILLTGEALDWLEAFDPPADVRLAPPEKRLPTAEAVWQLGRHMLTCEHGKPIDLNHLKPVYARRPEALRLWEERNKR
jgi:tRNA threonylcarbamoyladenosine biosynthesis protein TsaB